MSTLTVPRPQIILPPAFEPGVSLMPTLRPDFMPQPGETFLDLWARGVFFLGGYANALYDKGRDKFLGGSSQINWMTDTIKLALVTENYTPSLSGHEFYSDLGANVVGTDQTLTNRTGSPGAGIADADDPTWSGAAAPPASATQIKFLAFVKTNGGASSTWPLIGLADTATNLPLPPNGGSITVTFANSGNRIFKL